MLVSDATRAVDGYDYLVLILVLVDVGLGQRSGTAILVQDELLVLILVLVDVGLGLPS